MAGLAPVHYLSHGTPMVIGRDSDISRYWGQTGKEAQNNGIKGVIMMGAHWDVPGQKVMIATKPDPKLQALAYVERKRYADYKPNVDIKTAKRCIQILQDANIEAEEDPEFDWRIDSFPVLITMFPHGCPPTVIISQNLYFDPHFHMRVGAALRALRREGYLFIGSGGAVHNLYRAEWQYTIKYRDTFAMQAPPDPANLEFRQAIQDVICRNGGGPALKRGLMRLMKHPNYRDAHGTDDHYIAACFIAGLIGDEEDRGSIGVLGAEVWELRNICEMQFTIGTWPLSTGGSTIEVHG